MLARAYPRETQEMVFDAHERAFAFFRGACTRGVVYDNMKTAVETIFIGKDRQYNRRFLQMCSHHLVEPVTASGASFFGSSGSQNERIARYSGHWRSVPAVVFGSIDPFG